MFRMYGGSSCQKLLQIWKAENIVELCIDDSASSDKQLVLISHESFFVSGVEKDASQASNCSRLAEHRPWIQLRISCSSCAYRLKPFSMMCREAAAIHLTCDCARELKYEPIEDSSQFCCAHDQTKILPKHCRPECISDHRRQCRACVLDPISVKSMLRTRDQSLPVIARRTKRSVCLKRSCKSSPQQHDAYLKQLWAGSSSFAAAEAIVGFAQYEHSRKQIRWTNKVNQNKQMKELENSMNFEHYWIILDCRFRSLISSSSPMFVKTDSHSGMSVLLNLIQSSQLLVRQADDCLMDIHLWCCQIVGPQLIYIW